MKKYIILSVNDNHDYLFHVPLTCWAWRKFGWDPIIFYHGEYLSQLYMEATECLDTGNDQKLFLLNDINGYKSETIAQVSRLYGACVADGYLMTGDIDMIPLSNYWLPDENKLTVWGRDLTDYHYPICYIGAPSEIWKEIMYISYNDYNQLIRADLHQHFDEKADKAKQWVFDQDLITARINESNITPERIDRGTDKRTGYPIGRIDRSNWTLDHKQYIDCHMFHGIQNDETKFRKTLEMLHTVWPNENWNWWIQYVKEFKKLCHQKSQSVH